MIVAILIVFAYFSSSGLILFVCKLAQSNILPTEMDCYPYTNNKPEINGIKTNIFTTYTEPELAMMLEFPYDNYNSSNKILDMFRKYREKSSSHFLANYFLSIIENLLNFNYSSINTVMNGLNNLPEILIVLLGPILITFLFVIMLIVNFIYTIYLWFANMSWFFKTNVNETGEGLPNWEDVTLTSPISWSLGVGLVILFILVFFIGGGILLSFVPYAVLLICMVTCVSYKAIFNGKKASSLTIIKEVLKHYKLAIITILSFFIISLAFSRLGLGPGIFSIITVCLIYFGVVSIDIFKPIPETNFVPAVSYEQAVKKCVNIRTKGPKHGFLYNWLFGQRGGGNITRELKKIGKNLPVS